MANPNIPQPVFPLPDPKHFQTDPEKFDQALHFFEQQAINAKRTIEEMLYMLDLQEKVPWPDMLEKFSSAAATLSQIQSTIRKSGLQSGQEDHGSLLRSHVMVPQLLQLEPDHQLQAVTENRVYSWNHDVVPDYLRTKPNPEMEQEDSNLEAEKNSKPVEQIGRQTLTMNKHVELLLGAIQVMDRIQAEILDKPTFVKDDTRKLVRAIMCGEGLKGSSAPARPPQQSTQPQPMNTQQPMQQPQQQGSAQSQAGPTQSMASGQAAHPPNTGSQQVGVMNQHMMQQQQQQRTQMMGGHPQAMGPR